VTGEHAVKLEIKKELDAIEQAGIEFVTSTEFNWSDDWDALCANARNRYDAYDREVALRIQYQGQGRTLVLMKITVRDPSESSSSLSFPHLHFHSIASCKAQPTFKNKLICGQLELKPKLHVVRLGIGF
jgi:hypothetical protein